MVAIVLPGVCLLLALFVIGLFWFSRKLTRQHEEQRRRDKIHECIRNANDLAFPLMLIGAEGFGQLGRLVTYEDALNRGCLRSLATAAMTREFVIELRQRIIFSCHQWLGWTQPDPNRVHYTSIATATNAVAAQMGWPMQRCHLWVDYHSVPQASPHLQALALDSWADLDELFEFLLSCLLIVA